MTQVRVPKYCVEYLGHDREATCRELMDYLITRTRQVPTTPQLANLLCKSGYFIQHKPVAGKSLVGSGMMISLWSVNVEKAIARGWLEPKGD